MNITRAQEIITTRTLGRTAVILAFATLTGLAARVTIPLAPVPITLQVLTVLLAGLTLGSRDGALSQLAYLAAITAGLPLDARMLGPAVWLQATAGYLLGFVAGAFVAGWVWERARSRFPGAALAAGITGVLSIYFLGALWLAVFFLHGDLAKGFALGVAPFIVIDSLKAAAAAGLAEAGRKVLRGLSGGRG